MVAPQGANPKRATPRLKRAIPKGLPHEWEQAEDCEGRGWRGRIWNHIPKISCHILPLALLPIPFFEVFPKTILFSWNVNFYDEVPVLAPPDDSTSEGLQHEVSRKPWGGSEARGPAFRKVPDLGTSCVPRVPRRDNDGELWDRVDGEESDWVFPASDGCILFADCSKGKFLWMILG